MAFVSLSVLGNIIISSFQCSGWLNIYQRFIIHLCRTVYNILHSNTPTYLRELIRFNMNSPLKFISRYSSRTHQLSCPTHRTSKFLSAFSYTAGKFFNALPSATRSPSQLSTFLFAVNSLQCFAL